MKRSLLPLLFVIGLISLTSCKKEQTTSLEFTATMEECTDERNGKTVLNGEYLHWTADDQVRIYGNGWSDFAVTPLSPAINARFTPIEGGSLRQSSTYRAYYPSTLTTDGATITLPSRQTSVDGTLRDFPMYTESTTKQLAFKNLCGVMKLNLQKTGVTVTSIKLTMGSPINGTYTVSTDNGVLALNYQSESDNKGNTTTTLKCDQSINTAHDFYIYLPEGTYSGLTIEIKALDGTVCTKGPATSNVVIVRSQYSTLTLGGDDLVFGSPYPEGVLPGVFTVVNENSVTCTVHFSQGNLQYQASTTTWRFAEHQYDFVGDDTYGNVYENGAKSNNTSIGERNYTGWIDLFSWGTGNNPTACSYRDDYSHFVDWGVNAITGGGAANTWRTLSRAEWDYIFVIRPNASSKRGLATVNGVQGLVLLPDNWTMPNGITSFNTTLSDWADNEYDVSQWAQMEARGAVFLPAAGTRSGGSVISIGAFGNYWSYVSAENNDHPLDPTDPYDYEYNDADDIGLRFATFQASSITTGYHGWPFQGLSVRLVRNEN